MQGQCFLFRKLMPVLTLETKQIQIDVHYFNNHFDIEYIQEFIC